MRRLLSLLLLAVLGGLLLADPAGAAAAPPQRGKCNAPTVKQAAKVADVVFTGVLDKSTSSDATSYSFEGEQLYAGHLATRTVTVRASSTCTLSGLKPGKDYLVFARERQGALVTGTDDGTVRATKHAVHQVVKALGTGESLASATTPASKATYTKLATGQPQALSRVAAPGIALVLIGLLGLLVVRRRA